MVGAPSFHQPRTLRKRFNHGLGLTTLVMAALVTIAVLGFQGTILDVSPMPECAFTVLVPSESVVRASKATNIARQAGADEDPGGAPVLQDEAPPMADSGIDDVDEDGRVKEQTAWLKTLKGKYMPYGPKPWDKPSFTKLQLWVLLEPQQAANTKIINQVTEELRRITGTCPKTMKSKKNNAKLNWRKGATNGVYAHMTGSNMYDFLNRLNTIILPRVRDFEGLSENAFDKYGNFKMSFLNQEPFKELDELIDDRELVHGFCLGIVNNRFTQRQGLKLMKDFGFPFRDNGRWKRRKDDEPATE